MATTNGSSTARLSHFKALSSFVQIINAGMDVLKEKFSMSDSIFFIVLCKVLSSSFVGSASLTLNESPLWNSRQNFRRNLYTPSMPCVSQGLLNSSGPRNISYKRRVSAPNSSITVSGFTTLNMDLDIFSMAQPQTYFPSSKMNSALA